MQFDFEDEEGVCAPSPPEMAVTSGQESRHTSHITHQVKNHVQMCDVVNEQAPGRTSGGTRLEERWVQSLSG